MNVHEKTDLVWRRLVVSRNLVEAGPKDNYLPIYEAFYPFLSASYSQHPSYVKSNLKIDPCIVHE